MADPHPRFHELKNADLEIELARIHVMRQLEIEYTQKLNAEFARRMAPLLEMRKLLFAEAGLDPTKQYEFESVLQTIVEAKG